MKQTKLLSVLLALLLVFALSAGTFAAETGTITVDNPIAGQTYTAYKIFDVTYNADKTNYAYSIEKTSPWYDTVNTYAKTENSGLTLTVSASDNNIYVVTIDTVNFSAPKFAAALKAALANITDNGIELEGDKPTATGLGLGYYFVTSTNGALCNLTTTNPSVTIYDKNDITFEKTDDDESVEVGQVVHYTVTGKVPDTTGFTSYTYKITDVMSEGLTFEKDVVVKVDGVELANNLYTLSYGTNDFELAIDVMQLQKKVAKTIEVTYSATVNEQAVSKIEKNKAILTYSNNPADSTETRTIEEVETVYTAKVVIDKFEKDNETKKLAGAQFVLINDGTKNPDGTANDTNKGKFYKLENGEVSWVDSQSDATVVTTDANGAGSFLGLEDGDYKLREIAAPDGYNLLTADVNVTINGVNATTTDLSSLTVTKNVENATGLQLPSTGGMGTTLFYVLGSVLLLGAVVLLVVRRRMRTEK